MWQIIAATFCFLNLFRAIASRLNIYSAYMATVLLGHQQFCDYLTQQDDLCQRLMSFA